MPFLTMLEEPQSGQGGKVKDIKLEAYQFKLQIYTSLAQGYIAY
ncbi:MAG: hypothetical protein AAFY26_27040 [Cyanobacteria bacterium J06638_22]